MSSAVRVLIPPSLFSGFLYERNNVALILIFVEQFLVVYAPLMVTFLSFLQTLLRPESDENRDDSIDKNFVQNLKTDEPVVLMKKVYERFIDDKKATIGTKNDIKKLEEFGFNKYRFLSQSFMKRNNIIQDES
mmetsp:Transcript_4280/g.4442  ORF Transcript_4280/g.4442 Transcript_4280/m.4442 type:complete len:133 (-) Transcript_4280:511-909(-)